MSILDFVIPAAATVASGYLGSRGANRAADTASDAERYAADLQFQAANDVMDFQRNVFGYQAAQDAYNRQQAERALGMNVGAYNDQYGLTQRTFDIMGNQLGYGNNLRQNAMGNLQQFANLGLGALGGLSAMTGGSGSGITGPTPYNVQAPGAIAPLGPSQLNYQPQDTEALFRSILDNPAFQLPTNEDDEEEGGANNLSDIDLATSMADWYLGRGSGEAGGQSDGPAGQSGSPSQSGPNSFDPDFARFMGIEPQPNINRNTAIATAFALNTPLGVKALTMEEDDLNDLLGSWFGYNMPNLYADRDMIGLGDLEGSAGGMGGFIGSPAGGPSSGAGLGGFAGSPAGQAGGYSGDTMGDVDGADASRI